VTLRFDSYLNDVERFFSLVRLSGFVLSPRDVEKVRQWYLRGIPMEVVVAGILEGIRQYRFKAGRGEKLPHQLGFYSHFIGARVRAYRAPIFVREEEEPEAADGQSALTHLRQEMELLMAREERALERGIKEEALGRLIQLEEERSGEGEEGDLEYQLQVLDDEILALYHSRLDAEARDQVRAETEELLGREQGLSPRALEGRRKALEADILRRRLQLLELTR
jgi:hypothetical protein